MITAKLSQASGYTTVAMALALSFHWGRRRLLATGATQKGRQGELKEPPKGSLVHLSGHQGELAQHKTQSQLAKTLRKFQFISSFLALADYCFFLLCNMLFSFVDVSFAMSRRAVSRQR